ncbi:MAG: AAA family ATPase [Verrucomicrobiota bacterium]|nr:AAA family ATPase [Limisphaera sp.]MDW8380828.1 AAA family ATPase [Verrucomicrobiota bacterium]
MSEPISTQVRLAQTQSASGLNAADLTYMFFRHKWKILGCFLLGVAAATFIYLRNPPSYVTEAQILIRYILESRPTLTKTEDSDIKTPDSRGENIINSEVGILTSLDLALQVADAIGPRNVLAAYGGGEDRNRAAAVIRSGLKVDVPRRSNLIVVQFRHPDPAIARQVLDTLLKTYLDKHVSIHQGIGVLDDFFAQQADQIRARLAQTEEEIKRLKDEAQIISINEAKNTTLAELARLRSELLATEALLAEQRAALNHLLEVYGSGALAAATNGQTVPPDVAEQYRTVMAELEVFRRRETELQLRFGPEHPFLRRVRDQVADAESRKRTLEEQHPNLLTTIVVPPPTGTDTNDLTQAMARVLALEAKMAVYSNQIARLTTEANRIATIEPKLVELERRRELDEANLRYYSATLEKARVEESLGPGKITNISIVQSPSPAARDLFEFAKPMGLCLGGGLALGLALAFGLERLFNMAIRRPVDIERHLRLPLLLNLPYLKPRRSRDRNGRVAIATEGPKPAHDGNGAASQPLVPTAARGGAVTRWMQDDPLRPYFDGLRDRIVTYFEVRNMTHKPKLVAVTSCHQGAGVSTLAAGLAASLSETGDGNVLLVDMNVEGGATQHFQHGKPIVGLHEALEEGRADVAMVQENLYLVSAAETNDQKLPRVLPRRFANLVPKMKASQFDYIIFDMPPVAQTTITARLAGYMDMVLMVLEAERTGQDLARRAHALLQESRANVAAVLNKKRDYVPERLRQEL